MLFHVISPRYEFPESDVFGIQGDTRSTRSPLSVQYPFKLASLQQITPKRVISIGSYILAYRRQGLKVRPQENSRRAELHSCMLLSSPWQALPGS